MIRRLFSETFVRQQQEMQQQPPAQGFDRKTVVILCWTAIGLTISKYYGNPVFVAEVLDGWGLRRMADGLRDWVGPGKNTLPQLAWWAGMLVFVYFVVPGLLIRFLFKESLSDYGLKWKGAFHSWQLYVIMLALMLPLVVYFSTTESFQARYPFYNIKRQDPLWPNFWIWELLYFSQFFALEFFFRGFMTLGLRHRFGFYSIFVMTIPYCMIHFGKPMPETIGAILAGIVLGTLSMKSRSILLGVLIHYSVAITMDLCALWRKGFF